MRGPRVLANPLSKADAYAPEREGLLRMYLSDPDLQIDAKRAGIIQSLLSTCRLHGVHNYPSLVDILQRVATHLMNATL